MAKPYRVSEAQVLCKVEGTPGTAETLAGTDMVLVENFKFTPNYGDNPNTSMSGTTDAEVGASGLQVGGVEFDVVLKGSGTAGTAPEWRDLIMLCGFSETVVGATSVTYSPAAAESYYTIGFILPGLGGAGEDRLQRLQGCQGNAKFTFKAGDLRRMHVSATGGIVGPADSTVLSSPTWDTTAPTAFLNDAVVVHGTTLAFETLEFDMGRTVGYRTNANSSTGILTSQIGKGRVTGSIDFEVEKVATFDLDTRIRANTTGALAMTPVATAGNKVAVSLPKIRFTGYDYGDRAGAATQNAKFEAVRSSNAGNDAASIILT